MSVRLVFTPGWEARLDRMTHPVIRKVTREVGADARENLLPHNKTGELLGSLRVDEENGRVWIGSDHWRPIEYGARPHIETATPGHPMHIGFNSFAEVVRHPGNREFAPMRRALYKHRSLV